MRIAIAQTNAHLGNFAANRKKIIEFVHRAKNHRCDIVVFPEASLFGYHPMDLLERSQSVVAQLKELDKIKKGIPSGILVVIGAFTLNKSKNGKEFYNSAIALEKNKIHKMAHKELLPTYDVFDEARHLEAGDIKQNILRYKNKKILLTICEDIWAWPQPGKRQKSKYAYNPIKKIKPGSIDLVLNLSASPFVKNKVQSRHHVAGQTAQYLRAPLVYVNMVGGQDELIFDGGSFAIDQKSKLVVQCQQFVEELKVVDMKRALASGLFQPDTQIEQLRKALVTGIRDFVTKTGQQRVHLGLSGGIDSAVVACLAVDALGPQRVSAYALPGPYSSTKSEKLARELAENLHIHFKTLSINQPYGIILKSLEKLYGRTKFGLMHENLQARIRGLLLMAISNHDSSLLLNTSNKTELAAGYGTLYGDLAGALSPLGDLLKCDIVALANHYNLEHELIPNQIINRAPTAELRRNQKDEDSLPPYRKLDLSVVDLVEKLGVARNQTDKFLLPLLFRSEFKRWQAPPILKVREHSFGRGRRMPIAHSSMY